MLLYCTRRIEDKRKQKIDSQRNQKRKGNPADGPSPVHCDLVQLQVHLTVSSFQLHDFPESPKKEEGANQASEEEYQKKKRAKSFE
jgi:hypothetical protein